MCGIVGFVSSGLLATDKALNAFTVSLILDQERGKHATGVAKICTKDNTISIHKRAVSAMTFVGQEDTTTFLEENRARIYIGHNRYATMGSRDDSGAHPFQYKHITMVHNGVVDSWTLKGLEGFTDKDVTVDSEMVCMTIAERGIEEAVKSFSGAFSLVWWDANERSLNFLRNDKRPMYMGLCDHGMYFGSLPEFFSYPLSREKNFKWKSEPAPTKTDHLITYKFDEKGSLINKGEPSVKKLTFANVPDPSPSPFNYGSWGSYNNYSNPSKGSSKEGSYERRVRDVFNANGFHGLKCRDRISFDVVKFNPYTNSKVLGSVEGTYTKGSKTATVMVYGISKDSVYSGNELHKRLSGEINNCYKTQNSLTISLSSETVKELHLVKASARVIKQPFPLKVNGHVFMTMDEFKEMTCQGCAMCGTYPTPYDTFIADLTPYDSYGGIQEFVCGSCINEGVAN